MSHDCLCMSALLSPAHTPPHPLAGHVSNTPYSTNACFVLLKWQLVFFLVEQLCPPCNSCCKTAGPFLCGRNETAHN